MRHRARVSNCFTSIGVIWISYVFLFPTSILPLRSRISPLTGYLTRYLKALFSAVILYSSLSICRLNSCRIRINPTANTPAIRIFFLFTLSLLYLNIWEFILFHRSRATAVFMMIFSRNLAMVYINEK